MILGASILQVPLIEYAVRSGHETIVVSPDLSEPGHLISNTSICLDNRDKFSILNNAREYMIDGIITDQNDISVRSVAYVAEKMGLPGIGYETALLFSDKYLMREKCRSLGIKTLDYRLCESTIEVLDFYLRIGKEIIVKPTDSQGSRGVSLVRHEGEIPEAFQNAQCNSNCGSVLVEEYVFGREFVAEGIAFNNQFENLIIGDTLYFDLPNVFAAYTRVFPTKADLDLENRIKNMAKKIVKGFGLSQGVSHSEFIISGEDIILIETAARGGGVFISSDLIPLSTGVNTEEFLVNIALGIQNSLPIIQEKLCVCCYRSFFLPEGEVVSASGIDVVEGLPFTHRNNLSRLFVGKNIVKNIDKTSRFFIIISAKSHDELEHRIAIIKSELRIEVFSEEYGIRGPIWQ